VVELQGWRTLAPACSRKAEPGMVILTDSERVRLSRRMALEFLASSVDVSTAPQFQAYMDRYGANPERYGNASATVGQPVKIDNELHVRDYAKCILCYKCVEACGVDAQNTFALQWRAAASELISPPSSTCRRRNRPVSIAATAWACAPRRADVQDGARHAAGGQVGRITTDRDRHDLPYCGVGCDLTVRVLDGRIVRVTSPLDHSVTHGNLCINGRFGWQFVEIKSAPQPNGR
jgi:predicted molibdopterin-dependent oxidoreductase YjgC